MTTLLFISCVIVAILVSELQSFFAYNWHQSYFDESANALVSLSKDAHAQRNELLFSMRERLQSMSANLVGFIRSKDRFIQYSERQQLFSNYLKHTTSDLSKKSR
jgi:hypothetical protein